MNRRARRAQASAKRRNKPITVRTVYPQTKTGSHTIIDPGEYVMGKFVTSDPSSSDT